MNHYGSLATALCLVDEAAKTGADALKLQTYRPDAITLDSDDEEFIIRGGLWDGRTLYDLYQEEHCLGSGTSRFSTAPGSVE